MEAKETKHAYWIHAKIPNNDSISGFFYARECTCSECGASSNMERTVCQSCGAVMDARPTLNKISEYDSGR